MHFVGIDVGEERYFLVLYSLEEETISSEFRTTPQGVYQEIEGMEVIIAIDAPSGTRLFEHERRECEKALGIGGYFETPFHGPQAKSWMESGFRLWDHLIEVGMTKAANLPTQPGQIIEVHPTVIFKRLLNPNVEPALWIWQQLPRSKGTAEGRSQRRELLRGLFPAHVGAINHLNIDYLDALISAYAAMKSSVGHVDVFGLPEEGQIWVPH